MTKRRWDQGSEFHWPPTPEYDRQLSAVTNEVDALAWRHGSTFWMTGRAALRAILAEHGHARRMWVPSYFCQEVLGDLLDVGVALEVYPDSPIQPMAGPDTASIRSSDVVLVSNTFGLRVQSWTPPDGVIVIEDHTHDPLSPWALSSKADWCFASLRKWFPVPAGGVAWSPKGRAMAVGRSHEREEEQAQQKLASMLLKGLYLAGGAVEKRHYRQQSVRAEERIGAARGAAPSWLVGMLRSFPTRRWRKARATNFLVLEEELGRVSDVELLRPANDATAFSAVLALEDSAKRDSLREELIGEHIYPAILWNLEAPCVAGIPEWDQELSRRILSIHCDMRYGSDNMRRIAKAITKWSSGPRG